MQTPLKMTRAELALADKVGQFLIPVLRDTFAKAKQRDNATARFCREFAAMQQAREYLTPSASPMARVEIETRLLELAAQFVAAQAKE